MLGRWKREFEGGVDGSPDPANGKALQAELTRLRKENHRLKMEREILKKSGGPIALLCEVMQVSRPGYYSWRTRGKSARQQEYENLIPVVQEAHRISKGTYGARRISEEVEAHGTACGRDKARTLMKLTGVSAKQKRKFKVTTDSKHKLPVAPNLLNREFNVEEPDLVYVSDITYIWTNEGWLYLAVILDLFSRQIVSLKTERVFFTNYKSRDEASKDIVDYIEMFYNSRRRHSYLGYVSPRIFEKMRLLEKAA